MSSTTPLFELVEDKDGNHRLMLVEELSDERLTFGQRAADKISSFGGSWTFIFIFLCVLVVWVLVNSHIVLQKPYDPYPYILLNLFLSMLAAIQAPVIMMSNNRHSVKDRVKAELDYRVGLKAELEVELLHKKFDVIKGVLVKLHGAVEVAEERDKRVDVEAIHQKLDDVIASLNDVMPR